ncbi:MAG: DUF721 domain-containing protein [Myxococcales bacterium]|nr:DUF721 domain-containing protein [Myxococcales bacterium]
MQRLQSILGGLKELRVPAHVDRALPLGEWEAAVGPRIAARARPVRIERGVLHVRTATSAWAAELSMLAEDIVAKLAARGIAVRGLRFSVGALGDVRPAQRHHAARPPVRLPPGVAAAVAEVEDPELRRALAHAASRSLANVPPTRQGPGER